MKELNSEIDEAVSVLETRDCAGSAQHSQHKLYCVSSLRQVMIDLHVYRRLFRRVSAETIPLQAK